MLIYLYVSTVLFMFLFTIWTRKSYLNILLKFLFFGLSISGAFMSAKSLGIV